MTALTFQQAMLVVSIGNVVTVSDGLPEPPQAGAAWNIWRSHNFTGTVTGKSATVITIQLAPNNGATVTYSVTDFANNRFTLI